MSDEERQEGRGEINIFIIGKTCWYVRVLEPEPLAARARPVMIVGLLRDTVEREGEERYKEERRLVRERLTASFTSKLIKPHHWP